MQAHFSKPDLLCKQKKTKLLFHKILYINNLVFHSLCVCLQDLKCSELT